MSDFVHVGWALFVAGITIAGLLFCVFILRSEEHTSELQSPC